MKKSKGFEGKLEFDVSYPIFNVLPGRHKLTL